VPNKHRRVRRAHRPRRRCARRTLPSWSHWSHSQAPAWESILDAPASRPPRRWSVGNSSHAGAWEPVKTAGGTPALHPGSRASRPPFQPASHKLSGYAIRPLTRPTRADCANKFAPTAYQTAGCDGAWEPVIKFHNTQERGQQL
jgi:hypothetical protein